MVAHIFGWRGPLWGFRTGLRLRLLYKKVNDLDNAVFRQYTEPLKYIQITSDRDPFSFPSGCTLFIVVDKIVFYYQKRSLS